MEGRVGIAVLGAGYWGTKLCKEYALIEGSTSEARLSSVVDTSDSSLERVKGEVTEICPSASTKYLSSYHEVLDDPEIEGVHVAIPNELHYQVAREALEKGKHVMLEKPIATTSRDAFKLARLAEEKGLVLQIGHIFRFNNAIRTVKEVIRSGRLGRVFYANLSWATYMQPLPVDRDIVFDLAPHPIDILNYLLDEWPVGVDARGGSYVQDRENTEEVAVVNLEYPDRILAHLYLSWIHHGAKERSVTLICEKGTLTCDALDQKIRLDYDHTSVEIPVFPFDLRNVISDKNTKQENGSLGANNTIRDMQLHFIDQIRNRGPQMSSALIGARTVQVLEEITTVMRSRSISTRIYPKLSK